MTDYTKLIEGLRKESEFDHNHETLSMLLCAADAIEVLQAENERNKTVVQSWLKANASNGWINDLRKERDALQAKLDAMGKGEPVPPEQVEAAWRAGWAACRDAEFVGEEAEDEAWGMSETCANADWENAAPKALAPLTADQKNSAWHDHWSNPSIPSTACSAFYAGMRFAEKHHGIGGAP